MGAVVVGTTFEKNFKMPSFFLISRLLSSSDGGGESSEDSSDDMLSLCDCWLRIWLIRLGRDEVRCELRKLKLANKGGEMG